MRPGHVYRRQDLEGLSTAVDRDLKTLTKNGEALKLAWGLYCRPKKNAFGAASAGNQEIVRAFLKTEDFLLAGHDRRLVYNRKRAGEFRLGGKRFHFRVVRAYPNLGSGGESVVRENRTLRVVSKEDERSDLEFWLAKPPAERIGAVEFLREQCYALSGCKSLPRLAHAIQMRARRA